MKFTRNKYKWFCDERCQRLGDIVIGDDAHVVPISLCRRHARQMARGIERVLARKGRR